MKKIIAIMLALCVLFSFAACGGEKGSKGKETLTGTWQLFDEGASAPKATFVFNEDMTGTKTAVRNARTEVYNFTYTDDGTTLHIAYENNTVQDLTYELQPGKLDFGEGVVYTKAE